MVTISSLGSITLAVQKVTAQVVVAVTGSVEWKPQGGTKFNPVSRNMTLSQGNLLRLSQEASITISCPNGRSTAWTTPGTSGLTQICPPARPTSGRVITPRNGARDIPYAILPRATAILFNQPVLRWNAAVGANRFTLTIRGRELNWTILVNKAEVCRGQICEFVYPGEPPLQQNTSYRLVIETDNGRSSSEETTGGLGFKLLDATQSAEVNQIIERINTQNLPKASKALTLANLYTSYNLISDALQTLEAIPKPEKTAEIYRQLGDLYRQIALPLEAEIQYREAIAKATNNSFELAAAQAGLGEVSYALGRRDAALLFLQAAKTGYEALGDAERVTQLEERLIQMRSSNG